MARKTVARPDSDVLGRESRPLVLGDAPAADGHGQVDAVDKARLGLLHLGDTNAQVAAVGQDLHPPENARLLSQQAGLEGVESGSFCTTLSQDQHPKLKSNDNDFSSCIDQCSSPSMNPPWSLSLHNHDASTETSVVHLEKGDSHSGAHSNTLGGSEHGSGDSGTYPIPFIDGPPTDCWPCQLGGESIYPAPPWNSTPTLDNARLVSQEGPHMDSVSHTEPQLENNDADVSFRTERYPPIGIITGNGPTPIDATEDDQGVTHVPTTLPGTRPSQVVFERYGSGNKSPSLELAGPDGPSSAGWRDHFYSTFTWLKKRSRCFVGSERPFRDQSNPCLPWRRDRSGTDLEQGSWNGSSGIVTEPPGLALKPPQAKMAGLQGYHDVSVNTMTNLAQRSFFDTESTIQLPSRWRILQYCLCHND